jgi:hypothetical protein
MRHSTCQVRAGAPRPGNHPGRARPPGSPRLCIGGQPAPPRLQPQRLGQAACGLRWPNQRRQRAACPRCEPCCPTHPPAGLWNVPIIFVCENNHYGMGTAEWRAAKVRARSRAPAARKGREAGTQERQRPPLAPRPRRPRRPAARSPCRARARLGAAVPADARLLPALLSPSAVLDLLHPRRLHPRAQGRRHGRARGEERERAAGAGGGAPGARGGGAQAPAGARLRWAWMPPPRRRPGRPASQLRSQQRPRRRAHPRPPPAPPPCRGPRPSRLLGSTCWTTAPSSWRWTPTGGPRRRAQMAAIQPAGWGAFPRARQPSRPDKGAGKPGPRTPAPALRAPEAQPWPALFPAPPGAGTTATP